MKSNFELYASLNKCQARVNRKLEASLGAVHGLGVSEFLALHYLAIAEQQTMTRTALAELMGLTASGVTRLLLPMEKIGLVEKRSDQRDARKSMVSPSEAGRVKLAEAQLSFDRALSNAFEGLTKKAIGDLTIELKKIGE